MVRRGNLQVALRHGIATSFHIVARDGDWPVNLACLRRLDVVAVARRLETGIGAPCTTTTSRWGAALACGHATVFLDATGDLEAVDIGSPGKAEGGDPR